MHCSVRALLCSQLLCNSSAPAACLLAALVSDTGKRKGLFSNTETCNSFAAADCNVVASWGRGEDGQLGHGDAEQVDAPRAVHALLGADVSAVCCGAEYTVAVSKQHRRVYSWGW